ncbi:hypothetical protein Afil01_60550 [Actinorhabdospora filicis]|uniref:Uncharacterized protein n=1 Tax=Actinorhabdospora filicis TaxID=1785913 RepID=A0A9W6WCM8_9ACTN|nr:hypothetical protein [Actinorhabdospora filicis]GLZ81248.1 hypothetical protein Afil01_60550 [Actinorhabdospora filicis]
MSSTSFTPLLEKPPQISFTADRAPEEALAYQETVAIGPNTYDLTATATGDVYELDVNGCDKDGMVVARVTGRIPAAELTRVTRALNRLAADIRERRENAGMRADWLQYPNKGAPWTVEDERELTDRFRAGEEIDHIAGDLGRSPGSLRARLLLLGVVPKNFWESRYRWSSTGVPGERADRGAARAP